MTNIQDNPSEKHINNDITSPERVPRITGIELPFLTIQKAIKQTLDEKKFWEGVEEHILSIEKIIDHQYEFKEEFSKTEVLTEDKANKRFNSKEPVLFKDDFFIFANDFPRVVEKLLITVGIEKSRFESFLKEKGNDLLKEFTRKPEQISKDLAQTAKVDEFHVLYALNSSYQVLVVPSAVKLRKLFTEGHWDYGYCPMCGSAPEMGRIIEKDGHYYLCCSLCFTEWKFQRVICPFCGCDDQDKLPYFSVEEYPGYRVNVCQNCKSFIKVALEKDLGRRYIPVLDGVLTLELDAVAIEEGFHHGRIFSDSNA